MGRRPDDLYARDRCFCDPTRRESLLSSRSYCENLCDSLRECSHCDTAGGSIAVAVLYGSTVRGDETPESDVDVADLDAIRPEVGASALETGIIVGGTERVGAIRERFDRERETDETHEDRMRRFDSIL